MKLRTILLLGLATALLCLSLFESGVLNHGYDAASKNALVTKDTKASGDSENQRMISTTVLGRQSQGASSGDPTQATLSPSSHANDENPTLMAPTLEEWLADGTERAGFSGDSSPAKQSRVRIVEVDFKYPLIRVEETTGVGIATNASEPSREITAMVADHLIVSLAEGVSVDQYSEVVEAEGFTVREVIAENSLLVAFDITEGRDDFRYVQERLGDYQTMADMVEPDYIVGAHAQPANSDLIDSGKHWGLHNIGTGQSVPGADIDAIRGWDIRSRAPNTVVAVIDTGIRMSHEKLAPNIWRNTGEILDGIDNDNNGYVDDLHGYDFRDQDGDPTDLNGHGTHVAGIIGADDAADSGLVGVAWDVQIMALRFLGSDGYGATSDAIKCIDYARANGARILNNSWGGAGNSLALKAAIERSNAAGCIFVASAGNSNRDIDVRPQYPAAYSTPNIISVAATNSADDPTFFTCRGKRKVDIAAPGQNILSTGHYSDSAQRRLSGTSMAAPFVSGILALLDAEFPASANSQLINKLYRSADPLDPSYAQFWKTGGRANLFNALQTTNGRPLNDDQSNAYRSESSTWSAWEVNTGGASYEPNQPYTPALDGSGDLWFEFTAQSSQALRVSTSESQARIRCHVLDAGTEAVLLSFDGSGSQSIPASAGDRYLIAVETIGTEGGLLVLDVRQSPDNDERDNASVEEGLFWKTQGENGGATLSLGEDNRWGYAPVDRSVWWKWQAPRNGRFTLTTLGSDFDTVLSVYRDDQEFFIKKDSTHVIFAIDRSAPTSGEYRTSAVYDANNNSLGNEIIDQQIAAVISAIKRLRSRSLYYDDFDESLQVSVVLFDETAECLDLNPSTPEIEQWAYVSDFRHPNDLSDLYTALRTVTATEVNQVDYSSAFESAESLLESEISTNTRLVIMSPGQNIVESDLQPYVDAFSQDGRDFTIMAPSVVSDIAALQAIGGDMLEYANYREVSHLIGQMVAVNDDASWYGLWSRVTFNAIEGDTYYFGLAGYRGEYGQIKLFGRDPDFPHITQSPKAVKIDVGERAFFEVTATGQEPLLYQWYKDGEAIAGAHGSSYSIWSSEASDVGKYHVTVSNNHGEAVSTPAKLSTNEVAPRFTFTPHDKGFIEGESLRLLSATVGTQPISYQWYHNGEVLPSQTNAILNIPETTTDDAGNYYVVATNQIGNSRSTSAFATIISNEFNDWKLREGNPDQEHLNDITYGDQVFITVGDAGRIMQSNDATRWQRLDIDPTVDLKGVAYNDGVFIAAGTHGAVYLAESPSFWEPINLGVSSDWRNVEFAGVQGSNVEQ